MMTRAETAEWGRRVNPPCERCGQPIHRIETRYEPVAPPSLSPGSVTWQVGPTYYVCPEGHRHQIHPGR
jgi:hypothetical protein